MSALKRKPDRWSGAPRARPAMTALRILPSILFIGACISSFAAAAANEPRQSIDCRLGPRASCVQIESLSITLFRSFPAAWREAPSKSDISDLDRQSIRTRENPSSVRDREASARVPAKPALYLSPLDSRLRGNERRKVRLCRSSLSERRCSAGLVDNDAKRTEIAQRQTKKASDTAEPKKPAAGAVAAPAQTPEPCDCSNCSAEHCQPPNDHIGNYNFRLEIGD